MPEPMRHAPLVLAGIVASIAFTAPVRANEICVAEFQPIVQAHQQVMQQTQAQMPRGRPSSIDEARSSAQRACRALSGAQASFERLTRWMADNGDFCRLPEQMVTQANQGLANVRRNRTQACNAVTQIERQRRQMEAGGVMPGASGPQRLDLRTPGAL